MIPLLVIGGPTASGKTTLAIELAKRLDGEIVSADSMQIYRNMDIGTAKPSVEAFSMVNKKPASNTCFWMYFYTCKNSCPIRNKSWYKRNFPISKLMCNSMHQKSLKPWIAKNNFCNIICCRIFFVNYFYVFFNFVYCTY